ncbi:MAG: NifU family protein [bacterium]
MAAPEQPEPILSVTDGALARVRGYRAEGEAMWLEVTGTSEDGYLYGLYLADADTAGPGDARERHGDLDVVVPARSVPRVRGATVDWAGGDRDGGLVVLNHNAPCAAPPPARAAADATGELGGSVSERVTRVLEEQVNPAIAGHGGRAELVAVEGRTARLRLDGGCQGCGLASMTLTQGIETAITAAVPEISRVSDVTDHAAGVNPWHDPDAAAGEAKRPRASAS